MFRRKSTKISARSLRTLAIIYRFSRVSGFLVGINRHEREHYHECYEHKDIYQQNNKKNRMFQTDAEIQNFLLTRNHL